MFNTKKEIIEAIIDKVEHLPVKIDRIIFSCSLPSKKMEAVAGCDSTGESINLEVEKKERTLIQMFFMGKMERHFKKNYPGNALNGIHVEIDLREKDIKVYFESGENFFKLT